MWYCLSLLILEMKMFVAPLVLLITASLPWITLASGKLKCVPDYAWFDNLGHLHSMFKRPNLKFLTSFLKCSLT